MRNLSMARWKLLELVVDVGVMLFEVIVADKEFSGYENTELY
jgi:hypothetical protein